MKNPKAGHLLPQTVDPPRIPLCLEVPNDPDHLLAFWGNLYELTWTKNWQNDDTHEAALVSRVWMDVYRKAYQAWLDGGCGEEFCRGLPANSPRITWFPESPFNPNDTVPDGYTYHPFTVVTSGIISTVISDWGFGFEIGDVYTDLTKLPARSSWVDVITNLGNMPSFEIGGLVGTGTVKIHFLNIPQGGRALIQVDGAFNPLRLQLVELNKDIVSFPAETQTSIIVPVPITNDGTHTVKVSFLPTVDDAFIPLFFGGGLREIEICGFGEAMTIDPCCPEENYISYQVYYNQQRSVQQTQALLDDGDTAASFNAPSPFNGDTSANRENALCRTVNRFVGAALRDAAMQTNIAAEVIGAIERALPLIHPIDGVIGTVLPALTADHLRDLIDDCEAQRDVACCMTGNLRGQATTIENFRNALGDCGFTFGSHRAEIAAMVNRLAQDAGNARAFIATMDDDFQQAGQPEGANGTDCACECPCDDDIIPVDWAGTGCTFEKVGNCIWKITSSGTTGSHNASFKDALDRCLVWSSDVADFGFPLPGCADMSKVGCCGGEDLTADCNFSTGVWGGRLLQVSWESAAGVPNYYRITLLSPDDCEE